MHQVNSPHSEKSTGRFSVRFSSEVEEDAIWEFQPVQTEVHVGAGETAIVFYRLLNRSDQPQLGYSTYNVSPIDFNVYFSKIQCFCFNQQLINAGEQLLLPLFFYIEPQILDDPIMSQFPSLQVVYSFRRSAKQDLAALAQEEIERVEENRRRLHQIRAEKLKLSVSEYSQKLEEDVRNAQLHLAQLQQQDLFENPEKQYLVDNIIRYTPKS